MTITRRPTIQADYLIVGAGAAGMAFADSLLESSDASMVMVDRNDRAGGHWNNAYPFVRLHQPAAAYGVNSIALGSDKKDVAGPNEGFYELASGQEVLCHFDTAMSERLLPSGRVTFLPMSEWHEDGSVTSLLSRGTRQVEATKVVDATYSQISVPSTHQRGFEVAAGVTCVAVNDLPRLAPDHDNYVVIGAGKTGMDACVWLLTNGADPDTIRWIVPRDAWLLNRRNFQPGKEFFEFGAKSLADQVEALSGANSVDEVFARLEAAGELNRIDPTVEPTAYHCAIVSDGELGQLRRIKDVVRLGRVTRLEADTTVLQHGGVAAKPHSLYVDCSAIGIPKREPRPIFERDRITLQFVRLCQPTFSASLLGHVEAVFDDDAEKNAICTPIPPPNVPADWLQLMTVELANRYRWSKTPAIADWQATSRLDPFTKIIRSLDGTETAAIAHLQRYAQHAGAAVKNLRVLLGD